MNERIDELAKDCFVVTGSVHTDHFAYWKFAELIINECLNQCYNRGMNDELYAGQLRAAQYIENYFGVKNG